MFIVCVCGGGGRSDILFSKKIKNDKISSCSDNPSEKYQENDITFRSGKYTLKIRGGMRVPVLTYFLSV